MLSTLRRLPSAALVVAILALVVAMAGTAGAATKILIKSSAETRDARCVENSSAGTVSPTSTSGANSGSEADVAARPFAEPTQTVAIAGRCCESGDVLIWESRLPEVTSGDVLAVFSTGAYTYSMAGNYNRFPRPAVVLAGGGRARVVVERERYDDMVRKDVLL